MDKPEFKENAPVKYNCSHCGRPMETTAANVVRGENVPCPDCGKSTTFRAVAAAEKKD
jgi:DNA-directed RNA polymerase subunit RPC12/RpoP